MADAVGAAESVATIDWRIEALRQLQILIRGWLRSSHLSFERLQFGWRHILIHDRCLFVLAHFGPWRLQRPEHGTKDDAVEDDAANDEHRSAPAVATYEQLRQRRKHKGAEARAAHGNARGQRATRLEVLRHTDNGRQVDQPEAQARAEADGHNQRGHVLGEHADDDAAGGQDGACNGHRSTAVAIHKRRANGTWSRRTVLWSDEASV